MARRGVVVGELFGVLQGRRNIPTTAGGIFIDVRFKPEESHGFGVLLDDGRRWAAAAPGQEKLWLIARETLLMFPNARFRTGNCVLTAEQWREYLLRGVLPYPI